MSITDSFKKHGEYALSIQQDFVYGEEVRANSLDEARQVFAASVIRLLKSNPEYPNIPEPKLIIQKAIDILGKDHIVIN